MSACWVDGEAMNLPSCTGIPPMTVGPTGQHVRIYVLRAVTVSSAVFWDVVPGR
jgi:hypothetical protein